MVAASLSPSANEVVRTLKLRGGNREAWQAREREILVEGARGTGKTRTILELIYALCEAFPYLSVLIVRKYQRTLATTCLKTFNEQVLHPGDGVTYFGGNEITPASYRFPNGSQIVVGGMDNPDKVKSSEYDLIYPNEVTELTEDDFESLLPLLRHQHDGKRVIVAQRILSDANPADSGHWMNQRCERGQTRRIRTTMKDNPFYFDDDGNATPEGAAYLETLSSLTGSRRERWLLGLWTGTENACYPIFDRSQHVRPLPVGIYFPTTIIWVDYGSVHRCSVGALSIDQYNRRWVRECWGQPDTDKGKTLNLTIAQFKMRYATKRGRGDPNQAFLCGQHGFSVAKGGSGGAIGPPRLHRIDIMEPLFYTFPGGRVPTAKEEKAMSAPVLTGEPDSPGLFLVEGAPGNEEMAQQIEAYHYIFTEGPKGRSKDVFRDNEDHVAGMEYANEEYVEGAPVTFGSAAPVVTKLPWGQPERGSERTAPRRYDAPRKMGGRA